MFLASDWLEMPPGQLSSNTDILNLLIVEYLLPFSNLFKTSTKFNDGIFIASFETIYYLD